MCNYEQFWVMPGTLSSLLQAGLILAAQIASPMTARREKSSPRFTAEHGEERTCTNRPFWSPCKRLDHLSNSWLQTPAGLFLPLN